jgi:DNA polymerase
MLAHQVPPAEVAWQARNSPTCGVPLALAGPHLAALPSALHAIVPRSFVRLTELVVLHRDAARFELLYRLLWRLVHEPELAGSAGDSDMALAHSMAQAVRRDILRTRRALHLRALVAQDDAPLAFAWCEPQHHVTEQVAEALTGLVPQGPWLLASPDRSVLWTGSGLLCGPGVLPDVAHAAADAHWHALAAQLSTGEIDALA